MRLDDRLSVSKVQYIFRCWDIIDNEFFVDGTDTVGRDFVGTFAYHDYVKDGYVGDYVEDAALFSIKWDCHLEDECNKRKPYQWHTTKLKTETSCARFEHKTADECGCHSMISYLSFDA